MRWLLTPLGVGLLAFLSMGVEQASSTSQLVSATLHPAAYAGENRLSCGWHQKCLGTGPDPLLNGTDWYSTQEYGGYARVRLQSPGLGIAGWFKIEGIDIVGCYEVGILFKDREEQRIGTVTLLHINSTQITLSEGRSASSPRTAVTKRNGVSAPMLPMAAGDST